MTHLRLSANALETCCGKALFKNLAEVNEEEAWWRSKQPRWWPAKMHVELDASSMVRKCNCRECLAWLVDWLVTRIDRLEKRPSRVSPRRTKGVR